MVEDDSTASIVRWRDIKGFPGYRIGENGSVKKHCGFDKDGVIWRFLRSSIDKDGYLHIKLRRDGKLYNHRIHRLVLEHFRGPAPSGMECRHLNGDPADNRLENLAWSTHKENEADKVLHGTKRVGRGERQANAKLTEIQVCEIRYRVASGETHVSIARDYPVGRGGISGIVRRKCWAWLD